MDSPRSWSIRQAQLRERVERYANELEDRVLARTADLERSENRLAAILNALPDLVFVVDDEGRYVEILTSREDLLYRAAEEMKGRRFHDILPAQVADAHLRLVQRTLETRTSQTLSPRRRESARLCRTGISRVAPTSGTC